MSSIPAHDTDEFYWLTTEPPFTRMCDVAERLRLMREVFVPRGGGILSGSLMGWGDPLIPYFVAVIFLTLDPSVRLERLRRREAAR